ncbi:MAG: membrane-associated PAP2 superfamily phosphatase [Halopseudomonas sp.]|jgi:membrane-associated PAP2 superfamily phosphatase|uniref:Membrane-associated enzyme, PAP2 (Acid phosphatase) superfamily n=1 Tax=Halopseudomonas bauzanensis TaxID=653930 RepID=A0A031M4W4_9GAMM|nr:phosphatase PAP2 family protein [Halopseudomonas bauzanensis]EZQ15632.1 phosphoesterase [Halopseudomonas bauzanensis]SER99498.1 Membrane-associated enzyme, PAP2 (acid phosphatase) superfamily [Halopseudomonas bauzanensis]SFM01328.1 Membrane-associated enzyme, PAP2 (acid phosphatase) superfamily [Halopseudomonas bauzanensis]|tara:strand:+ start:1866 stop:2612 length:747 start_codon:yes stop_codon:yes gene_type:complete
MKAQIQVSRPFNFRLWLALPFIVMTLMLLVDPGPLDVAISNLFYQPGEGFIGRHSFFLEDILHDRAKQAVIVIGVLAIVGFLLSLLPTRLRVYRRSLGYLVLAMALCTSLVTPLKALTNVHCPWSLQQYGGDQVHTPLLGVRPPSDKAGRCWPGGHASSGFSLLALFFLLRDRRPRAARTALIVALTLGAIFSIGRTMQGAHFMSHNLWTLLFDWCISLLCYRLILYRQPPSLDASRSLYGDVQHGAV